MIIYNQFLLHLVNLELSIEKRYGKAIVLRNDSDGINLCWGKPCSQDSTKDITKEEASDKILMIKVYYYSNQNTNTIALVEHLSYLGAMYFYNREKYYK